jgi:hypothetical protein
MMNRRSAIVASMTQYTHRNARSAGDAIAQCAITLYAVTLYAITRRACRASDQSMVSTSESSAPKDANLLRQCAKKLAESSIGKIGTAFIFYEGDSTRRSMSADKQCYLQGDADERRKALMGREK